MLSATNITSVGRAAQCLALAAILAATSAATADVTLSETVLQIQASNAAGSGMLEVSLDSLTWDGQTQSLWWESDTAVDIVDSETEAVIATLSSATLEFRGCSEVALSFQLEAGDSDTTVIVRSGQLSFATIGSDVAEGRATASFLLRDLNADGAQMVGLSGGAWAHIGLTSTVPLLRDPCLPIWSG